MIPDFWRSRLSSNFGTSKCMLAASIWVAWHLHSLYGVGEASEVRGTETPPGTRVTSSEPLIDSEPHTTSQYLSQYVFEQTEKGADRSRRASYFRNTAILSQLTRHVRVQLSLL